MLVRYRSLGAARSVTGSRHYFEFDDFKLLLDCGMFQGSKPLRLRNWDSFPVNPTEIDAVVLSHAHIDHSGYLPKLVKEGFNGPIYCTAATASLLKIMLLDSAKLQQEEAEWASKKGYSKHSKPEPLYTEKDAENVFPLLSTVRFKEEVPIHHSVSINLLNAGHILGASIVELIVNGENQIKKIVFSGDLGRQNDPIMFPPTTISTCDILLVETTYGNRVNKVENVEEEFSKIINETCDNGCLLIPAFSVGRTQNMLYYLKSMMEKGMIKKIPVYIDSPMAISVTDLYKSYKEIHKLGAEEMDSEHSIFDYGQFRYVRNQTQSAMINETKKNAIIISASGMCTGGRILHHLYHRLPNPQDTVLLVGYQAEGTRGSDLSLGVKNIKIFGQDVEVKCRVEMLHGLSAHADKEELTNWLSTIYDKPKLAMFVHGEFDSSMEFANYVRDKFMWNVSVPRYLESFELFNGI